MPLKRILARSEPSVDVLVFILWKFKWLSKSKPCFHTLPFEQTTPLFQCLHWAAKAFFQKKCVSGIEKLKVSKSISCAIFFTRLEQQYFCFDWNSWKNLRDTSTFEKTAYCKKSTLKIIFISKEKVDVTQRYFPFLVPFPRGKSFRNN